MNFNISAAAVDEVAETHRKIARLQVCWSNASCFTLQRYNHTRQEERGLRHIVVGRNVTAVRAVDYQVSSSFDACCYWPWIVLSMYAGEEPNVTGDGRRGAL